MKFLYFPVIFLKNLVKFVDFVREMFCPGVREGPGERAGPGVQVGPGVRAGPGVRGGSGGPGGGPRSRGLAFRVKYHVQMIWPLMF